MSGNGAERGEGMGGSDTSLVYFFVYFWHLELCYFFIYSKKKKRNKINKVGEKSENEIQVKTNELNYFSNETHNHTERKGQGELTPVILEHNV